MLEQVTDTILDGCVDLDPDDRARRRRSDGRSDGRSAWIEPSARHHTSTTILAQEGHITTWVLIITWVLDRYAEPARPSTTVAAPGLI